MSLEALKCKQQTLRCLWEGYWVVGGHGGRQNCYYMHLQYFEFRTISMHNLLKYKLYKKMSIGKTYTIILSF